MWYIAVIILTEPQETASDRNLCESCNVLIEASSAQNAYRKAVAWGQNASADHMYGLTYFGIEVLHQIGEKIGDGVDISGRMFEKMNVWHRKDSILPAKEELSAIRLESSMDDKLGDVVSPYQQRLIAKGLNRTDDGGNRAKCDESTDARESPS